MVVIFASQQTKPRKSQGRHKKLDMLVEYMRTLEYRTERAYKLICCCHAQPRLVIITGHAARRL